MSRVEQRGWIRADEVRVGDLVQAPDGGGSSRARFASEHEARACSAPFLRVDRIERAGNGHVIPSARGETAIWLEDGSFRRWPDDARVLVRRG